MRSFLYSLINCEQFRTEKPARKAFFIRIVRICIVGQSDAIIGEGVLIRDYRLTHITFETPLTHPDVQTSIKNFRSQKIKNFRDRPFNGRFFLWAFHFIFFLRELNKSTTKRWKKNLNSKIPHFCRIFYSRLDHES